MNKKTLRRMAILLFLLIFFVSGTGNVFAAQSIVCTTNGAAGNYIAGSVLVLYGKVTDGGQAVANTKVTVDIKDPSSKVIYYGQLKTDSRGYFKTSFTIPSGVGASMNATITSLGGGSFTDSYPLTTSASVTFTGFVPQGYLEGGSVVRIPASTEKLGLVFSANVNYFNNRESNLDLASLGIIERNEDCIALYQENSNGSFTEIGSSLDMVSSDVDGGNITVAGITYLSGIAARDKKNERKDVLYLVPDNALKSDTTYKVVIDSGLCANSSATLGSDLAVYFKTEAAAGSSNGGTGTNSASSEPTVPASQLGSISTGTDTKTLSVSSAKAETLLKDSAQKSLAIDLSGLETQGSTQVNVTLPANVLALATTEKKPIILNYGDFVMVIPAGSLPTDKEITLEAKKAGTPSGSGNPGNVTGLQQFELSAVDSNGNDIAFKNNLDMEFDIPDQTVKVDRLCVFYVDDKTGKWIYSGGRIVNGKLTFSPAHYSTYVVAESTKTFTDISNSWAKDSIEAMVARQISKGVSDSLFAPDKKISRAEFSALLARVLGLEGTGTANTFSDISDTAWYKDEVAQIAALGIVTGDGGKFRPNDSISRQEMAVMLSRAAKYVDPDKTATAQLSYTDNAKIASWASAGVAQISGLKIMSGYPDGSFGGSRNSTRAEATKTLKSFMDEFGL